MTRTILNNRCLVALLLMHLVTYVLASTSQAASSTLQPSAHTDESFSVGRITVTAEDIRHSATTNLADFLDSLAGITVTRQHGMYGSHHRVDMLASGAGAPRSVLILLNGQPFHDSDQLAVDLAAIPLEAISRIDIFPGTGATRYGADAASGIIDIRIRQGTQPAAGISIAVGSYQSQAADAWAGLGNPESGIWMAARTLTSDGYRANNAQQRHQGLVHVTQSAGRWRTHAILSSDDQTSGLPGARLVDRRNQIDQLHDDPWGTSTPDDRLEQHGWRLQPGIEATTEIADLSLNATMMKNTREFVFLEPVAIVQSERESYRISPTASSRFSTGPIHHGWTGGVDFSGDQLQATDATTDGESMVTRTNIRQERTGIFLQHSAQLHSKVALSVGARRERVQTRTRQKDDTLMPQRTRQHDYLTTGEARLRWILAPGLDTFFNSARTTILADFNEKHATAISPEPQRGWLHTAGLGWQDEHQYSVMTLWQSDHEDEIQIHPDKGIPVNLAEDTRRRGINLTSRFLLDDQVVFIGGFTYQKAEFSSGMQSGKQLAGVPGKTAQVQINWEVATGLRLALAQGYTGARYYPGDSDNAGRRIPAHTWTNLMVSATTAQLHWSLGVFNLQDRLAWETGFADASTGQYNAMPLPGRHYLLTVRVSF